MLKLDKHHRKVNEKNGKKKHGEPVHNDRSILENPKQNKNVTVNLNVKEGLVTKFWRTRITKLFKSLIPSHIDKNKQIWLDSVEKLDSFIQNLKNPGFDLSNIEYVCIPFSISDIYDVIDFLKDLRNKLPDHVKLIYSNYNWKWALLFKLSALFGFSRKGEWGNFYRDADLDCFLDMSGWENVKKLNRFLLPFEIWGGILDSVIKLPLLNKFSLNTVFIARKKGEFVNNEHTVTILVPCKNEEGNIEAIVTRTPSFGKSVEILFVNDKSTDQTEAKILEFQSKFSTKNIKIIQGQGLGKGVAIRDAMSVASGDICMILDADLSVIPEDLPQFYEAINLRRADFLHGTRLVYPQEEEAMKLANTLGNIFFSMAFSYILDQRVTDTLCGTKVFWRRDWLIFEETRGLLNDIDVWGDYNLIFGAARFGLKIGELPVRYFQRLKGLSKMTRRLKNGLIMLRVAWHALLKIKFGE